MTADCLISATNIDFGEFGRITSPVTANGTVTATCSINTSYSISLSAGQGSNASVNARKLSGSGGNSLTYMLYSDGARTTVWGDGTGGTSMVTGTGTGGSQTITVYASLAAPAAVPPDSYTDTLTATITY